MKEMDIVDFLRNKRISEFTARVALKEHQAYFVGKFRKFCTLYEKFDADIVDDLKKRTKTHNDQHFGAVGYVEEDFTNDAVNKMVACLDKNNKYDAYII